METYYPRDIALAQYSRQCL